MKNPPKKTLQDNPQKTDIIWHKIQHASEYKMGEYATEYILHIYSVIITLRVTETSNKITTKRIFEFQVSEIKCLHLQNNNHLWKLCSFAGLTELNPPKEESICKEGINILWLTDCYSVVHVKMYVMYAND